MNYDDDDHGGEQPQMMPIDQIKTTAAAVAEELGKASTVSPQLRERFIEVRSALFQRGIFDPVLVRFDSATVPHATNEEIANQLASVAESL